MFYKKFIQSTLVVATVSLLMSSVVHASFTDVGFTTKYRTAINHLQSIGVIEGYVDGSFKPNATIKRDEFLKIVLEARGDIQQAKLGCFSDVIGQWSESYVCSAKAEGIISGYPQDNTFRPSQAITFVEAAKILAKAYGQSIDSYSPDWYEPFARALENSKAIPPTIAALDAKITRGEMAEMMWRLSEGETDVASRSYLNVKYPDVSVDLAANTPQIATSCVDLKAFAQESNRQHTRYRTMEVDMAVPMAAKSGMAEESSIAADADYSETNVQVQGVDEADIVKTDGLYLYTLQDGNVYILDARSPTNIEIVSKIDFSTNEFYPSSLYIHGDQLVIIGSRWDQYSYPSAIDTNARIAVDVAYYGGGSKTEVRIYDISDIYSPESTRTVSFQGSEVSTRLIDGKVYLVLNESIRWFAPEPRPVPLAADVLPKFEDSATGEESHTIVDCATVTILPRIPNPQYIITAVIPVEDNDADIQREVIIGNADNLYASRESLYVAATEWQYDWTARHGSSKERTNIYRFAYVNNGLDFAAVGSVPGRLLNQFSMDEHDSHFRLATTEGQVWNEDKPSLNNLFVLNMDLQQTGAIRDIAPGERIYSVRFMGKRGYMVTFKKVDPFFVFDLSNPRNPTILGKLKIPGYSDYLHPYDENHIIGFGKEAVEAKGGDFAWYQGMKMAIFNVTDPSSPTQLHNFVIGDRGTDSPLLHNHKALLFDKSRNLLSFPVRVAKLTDEQKANDTEGNAWGETVFQGAYVFGIDIANGFQLRGSISHYTEEDYQKSGSYFYGKDVERIVRIGNHLFTISQIGVQSHAEQDLEKKDEVLFNEYGSSKEHGQCPDSTENAWFASKDPDICHLIDYSCPSGQKHFSGDCGCGCY